MKYLVLSETVSKILEHFVEVITSVFGEAFDTILSSSHFVLVKLTEGFVYLFNVCIYGFTNTVFSNFDESKIIFVGEFTLDSIFSHNFATSDLIFNNFLFFIIGLIAFVFVFKLFFKIVFDLFGAFIHALF